MRRTSLVLAAALGIFAGTSCDKAPTAAPPPSGAEGVQILAGSSANSSATGVVRYVFGATTAHLSFIATTNGSSVATGKALYYSSNANVVMVINVTCLYVSSGTARFLGTILESNDTGIEGDDAYWEVRDASPDQASLINIAESGTGPDCSIPSEFDLVNVAAGTITVS
jgi:hypothetical protein